MAIGNAAAMKKAVFVSLGVLPCPETRKATEVRAWQNLTALRALGYSVTVVTTPDSHGRSVPEVPVVMADPAPHMSLLECYRDGRYRRYRRGIRKLVAGIIESPATVLFCEHWLALACSPRHARLIYSLHDFESQLVRMRRVRQGRPITWTTRLHWQAAEVLEAGLLRKAARVICVSATEARTLEARRRGRVEYIPIVPADGSGPPPAKPLVEGPARLWFYGNSAATANKIILDHLAGGLFALLRAALPDAEFHQAGLFNAYDPDKVEWLDRNFTVHGYLENPVDVFRPGDFCLIPYQFDTGFRTKIPEVCGYGMIPVGYPISFASCPEMRNGYNCVMASDPADLAAEVASIHSDRPRWMRMAAAAIETRVVDFSHAVLFERYRRMLDFNSRS